MMNRTELIEAYVDRVLNNMSTKDLMRIVGDQLEENLFHYTDEELISEIGEYYPELLEEGETFFGVPITEEQADELDAYLDSLGESEDS